MKKLVLFADTTHPALPELLTKAGFECKHYYGTGSDEFSNLLAKAGGLIIRSKFKMDEKMFEVAGQLKFIGRVGAGMENIDEKAALNKGVILFNAPEGNRDAVGEHSLGMLLALRNKIIQADSEVRKGIWLREENRGYEIQGKTIAIIGFGNMGSALAQRLKGFDMNIIAYDKYKSNFGNEYVQEVDMDTVFSQADIVSLHVPLTDETNYLVNKKWISEFKKPFTIINTSRGKVLNTRDLIDAMESGKIDGACLDVLEFEKTSFEQLHSDRNNNELNYLIQSPKVVLTPHIAGWTHESNLKLARVLSEKIIRQFGQ